MKTSERDRSAESVKRRKCRLTTGTSYCPKNNCGSRRFSPIRSDLIIQDGHISITHIYGTLRDQCPITSRLPVSVRMSQRKAWPSSTTVGVQTPSGALPGFGLLNSGPHVAPRLPYRGSENFPHRKTLCTYFNKKHYGNNCNYVNKIRLTHIATRIVLVLNRKRPQIVTAITKVAANVTFTISRVQLVSMYILCRTAETCRHTTGCHLCLHGAFIVQLL